MRRAKAYQPGHVSLERALSKLGIASRTKAREWILAGKVRVNGVIRKQPAFAVFPERAKIEIEGQRKTKTERRIFVLHKPRGVVTTHRDEKGRPTVFSLVEELGLHLIAVGRLDWATSGLLILTNDTKLANFLTDPENGIPRTYLVSVRGKVNEGDLRTLMRGIKDQGELLKADQVVLRKASARESHLTVTLTEGKNRELRRLFAAIGHELTRLKRVSYGALELGNLAPGEYREISLQDLQLSLRNPDESD